MRSPPRTRADGPSGDLDLRTSPPHAEEALISVVEDLVQHARTHDLALADEVLTDVLAKLHGWPVEELNRLS